MPDLARLAREVAETGTARLLREDGADVAVLSPARMPRRRKGKTITQSDIEASLAAAGGWTGLGDPEQLKRDLDAARGDSRPPVEL